jgi:response regulator RpfG family c-di-GMP phosphodiesterase
MSGDHVPLAARIVAVADCLDALRIGAPTASWAEIWEALAAERSLRLDPTLVDAALLVAGQVEELYRKLPPDPVRRDR